MTEEEVIHLAKYVAALCPAQRFNEFTPDAWIDVLSPYNATDARTAVVAIARRQPFISPAEIIAEIQDMRRERITAANLTYDGNPDETGLESTRSVRALVQAAGDGYLAPRTIRAALEPAPGEPSASGRARALLAGVGRELPRVREGVVNVLAVACPRCSARPGRTCTTNGKRRADVHPARLEDARRAAAGLPPVDPAESARELQRRIDAAAAALAGIDPASIQPQDGFPQPDTGTEAS
ncbi:MULTISPECIES: zinc finger domain-containing protein [Streptomyces]|uniref:zinc finger domain-containing protein n=1 Tax=Streptomyces lycopersici TaxID=2974589 RepID=UPI0021D29298|nr:hypothetical protein [Streptomyces sp. NEAU-383]